jgi:hypothetical protein
MRVQATACSTWQDPLLLWILLNPNSGEAGMYALQVCWSTYPVDHHILSLCLHQPKLIPKSELADIREGGDELGLLSCCPLKAARHYGKAQQGSSLCKRNVDHPIAGLRETERTSWAAGADAAVDASRYVLLREEGSKWVVGCYGPLPCCNRQANAAAYSAGRWYAELKAGVPLWVS